MAGTILGTASSHPSTHDWERDTVAILETNLDDLPAEKLLAFRDRYNREWLIARHGHRSPAAVRDAFATQVAA